jgi:hypothetical protein
VRYWISAADNKSNRSFFPIDTTHSYDLYLVHDSSINNIKAITFTPLRSGYSLLTGDTLTNMHVKGIVMSTNALNDLGRVIIQSSNQPWCGIWLNTGTNLPVLKRGDLIQVTGGIVNNTSGMCNLTNVTYSFISSGNTLPASVKHLNPDSCRLGSYVQATAYRNMLVEFDSAYVISQNADAPSSNFGEWTIHTNASAPIGFRCLPLSADFQPAPSKSPFHGFNYDSLKTGQFLKYIKGIMDYANSEWKIAPRNQNDIFGYKAHALGIREITNINNLVSRVYPNPASDKLNWEFSSSKATAASINVYELSGRLVMSLPINITPGNTTWQMEVPRLSNGIYMVQLADANTVLYSGKVVILQ